MATPDLRPVLRFSAALRRNNNRAWFQAHRSEYDEARSRFEAFVADLIDALRKTEPLGALRPRDCIFRVHRDLRFTPDKTPYKPYLSAYVAPGGRKSRRMGLYLHLERGNSMLAGGLHEPDPQQLAAWRASIDRDPTRFRRLTSRAAFRRLFDEVGGERLKTAPRGYPKDHPDLDLLRLKRITVSRRLSDEQVVSRGFLRTALATHRAMKPFLDYLEALV